MRGAGQALDRLLLAHCALLERAEHGIEFIELHLREVQVVQKVLRQGPELLRRLQQPLQHRVRIDLEHSRGAADAQALSEAADDVHDEVDRDALAMEQGAVMLGKVPFAGRTVELTPLTPAGMAVGAQVAQPQPAAVVTVRMRTKVPRGVDGPGASVGRGQRLGSYRRRWRGLRRVLVTQDTERLARQAAQRVRLLAAWASGRAERSGPWFLRPTGAWPRQRQHDKQPQESHDDELRVKEVWNHCSTPLHGDVRGALYSIPGPGELSAAKRYTTLPMDWGASQGVDGLCG